MELRRRIILLVFAVILSAELVCKGHGKSAKTDSVAFLRQSSVSVTFRLSGDAPGVRAGVYSLPVGATVGDVMKMALKKEAPQSFDSSLLAQDLHQGDIVKIAWKEHDSPEISIGSMPVRERMLLGIPLEPDMLDASDWEVLPGIGPKLARAIVDDRQNNGDFGCLEGLKRVPGVGEKLLHRIALFF
jgi:competence protein ComEA